MEELPTQSPNANFAGPIPGASLTTEVGNRPWENPPKESSLDKIITNYIRRLRSREIVEPILDAIRYGTSITTIVESVIETAVMEGEHTIDTGILASPVIVEYLKQACELSNIDYKLSAEDVKKQSEKKKISSMLVEEVLKEMEQEEDSPISDVIETSAEEIKESNKGLMARKNNKDDKDGI
jgi:hypothetical protein|tara:strand:- start:656 stop:1201 length:546 start_codon:yes stop_codon:yes gene_type:complete